MNHPKGLTVDDRGNVYIADTLNMAIRKISDSGNVFPWLKNEICFYNPSPPARCMKIWHPRDLLL